MAETREPARPTGLWMLQHARAMRQEPLRFLTDTAAELGDVVEFPIPRQRVFFVDDPAAVQRVLKDNHRSYGKRTVQYDALALVTGQGLLTADLDPWRENRRIQQPAFHHSSLEPLSTTVVAAADRLLDRWDLAPDGSLVDVDAAMMRTALEIVGEALFSADLAGSAGVLVEAVLDALGQVVARAQNPFATPLGVPTPGNRRMLRALRTLDSAVAEIVGRRRASGEHGQDLLGLLLASGLSDEQVRDEVATTIVAGHETVASALTWVWDLLGRNEETAWRLRDEVDVVLGRGSEARAPTGEDYGQLIWTRQVLDETLRLYPPAWVITRKALVDDVLAGVAVPAGSLVIICTFALHRRPEAWPDPERFDPGRFDPDRRGELQRSAYAPFGSGPRLCIGRDFALLEGTLLLARISQRYVLRPQSDRDVPMDAMVTIRPRDGLPMQLQRRFGSLHVS